MTTPTDEEAIKRIAAAMLDSGSWSSFWSGGEAAALAKAAWREAQAIMTEREAAKPEWLKDAISSAILQNVKIG